MVEYFYGLHVNNDLGQRLIWSTIRVLTCDSILGEVEGQAGREVVLLMIIPGVHPIKLFST